MTSCFDSNLFTAEWLDICEETEQSFGLFQSSTLGGHLFEIFSSVLWGYVSMSPRIGFQNHEEMAGFVLR